MLLFVTLLTSLNAQLLWSLNDYERQKLPDENDELPVNIDRTLDQVSNMVEDVAEIGENWISENTVEDQEPDKTTAQYASSPATRKLSEAPDTDPMDPNDFKTNLYGTISRTVACFFGRFSFTPHSTTPSIPPSKPVTSYLGTTAEKVVTEGLVTDELVTEEVVTEEVMTEEHYHHTMTKGVVTSKKSVTVINETTSSSATMKTPTTDADVKVVTDAPDFPASLIKLCKNPFYKPPCVFVTEDTPQLSELDDEISSIKVYAGVWKLYTGSNYTGNRSWVRAGYYHPWLGVMQPDQGAQIGLMNDDLSSLRLFKQDSEALIMLCKNDRYNPPCINVTNDIPDLKALDNQISAIKVYKGIWQLFTGKDFTGRRYWVSEGYQHPWLGVMKPDHGRNIRLGDDRLSSLRVHYSSYSNTVKI